LSANFNKAAGLAVDRTGNVVVVDAGKHTIRKVTKEGYTPVVVSTVAGQAPGKGQAGFINGGRENARFKDPSSVVVAANGNIILSDTSNHAIRVVTPAGSVRTLVDGQKGFADGQVGFGH
jgi:hypothetical protein